MIKTAIVLAGGFGTRLRGVVSDVPKPMAPVAGAPFLEYILRYLKHYGISEVVLSVGYLAEKVMDHFGDRFEGLTIHYAHEKEPLGTGGAIRFAFTFTQAQKAIVLNGDSFFDVDLQSAMNFHERQKADGTIVLRDMPHPDRFGTVTIDKEARITAFNEKLKGLDRGLINTGVYLLDRQVLESAALPDRFSIEEDFFKPLISAHNFRGMVGEGYFIDIGIPEEFDRAQEDFRNFRYSS